MEAKYVVLIARPYRRTPAYPGEVLKIFADIWKAIEYKGAYREAGQYEIWIERRIE